MSKKIEAALTRLEPYQEILEEMSSTGGRVSFFVGWFLDEDTGDTLDWPILQKMSQLRIALEMNVYVPLGHSDDDDTN